MKNFFGRLKIYLVLLLLPLELAIGQETKEAIQKNDIIDQEYKGKIIKDLDRIFLNYEFDNNLFGSSTEESWNKAGREKLKYVENEINYHSRSNDSYHLFIERKLNHQNSNWGLGIHFQRQLAELLGWTLGTYYIDKRIDGELGIKLNLGHHLKWSPYVAGGIRPTIWARQAEPKKVPAVMMLGVQVAFSIPNKQYFNVQLNPLGR